MRGKRLGAMLLSVILTASLLGGCGSGSQVTEDMIPAVTDLRADEGAEASVIGLAMNKSYVAELTRLDGDNTQAAVVEEKEIPVVLKATSVDKDLKVKIVNQKNDKVITGTAFEVSVTDSASKTKSYTDSDKDGIIYIESMEPGKCTISMKASGGYSAASDITAEVKANIEYTVVDISDEIKSESEINVAQEDSNTTGNSDAGTAQILTDTVEYVESSKTEITEEVKTQKVDAWGQLMYTELAKDKYGNDMYTKIISEPAADHKDDNGDNKCDRCGADLTPAHTHSYTATVTEPTCGAEGYTIYTCSCGNSYKDNVVPATGEHVDANNDGKCDVCGTDVLKNNEGGDTGNGGNTGGGSETGNGGDNSTGSGSDNGTGTSDGTTQTPPDGQTPGEGDPAAQSDDAGTPDGTGAAPSASVHTVGLKLLAASSSEVIVYDKTSAPIYNTGSEPVYEITQKVTGYKYTGWQTLDGATYYFDKNGNKVTGTQVIQGIQYTFSDEGVRSGTIGIDVSKYQSSINWQKVKNAGINFVIIRCGYRGYGSGVLVQDPMFASHITGAKAAGLRVGIYFFSQAITEAEAVEEASMAVKLANQYGINMPIAIDSEYANGGRGRADGLSKSDRTRITVAFCNTVANAGYKPMVYASKNWFSEHLDVSQFPSSYRIWVAHYATTCGYTGRYDIWQNTSKGSVDGVRGNVDMNISSI